MKQRVLILLGYYRTAVDARCNSILFRIINSLLCLIPSIFISTTACFNLFRLAFIFLSCVGGRCIFTSLNLSLLSFSFTSRFTRSFPCLLPSKPKRSASKALGACNNIGNPLPQLPPLLRGGRPLLLAVLPRLEVLPRLPISGGHFSPSFLFPLSFFFPKSLLCLSRACLASNLRNHLESFFVDITAFCSLSTNNLSCSLI